MVVSGYRNALIALRREPNDGSLRLAFLTASLIYSMTEAGFRMLSPVWFVFLLAIAGNSAGLLPRVAHQPIDNPAACERVRTVSELRNVTKNGRYKIEIVFQKRSMIEAI